MKATHKRHKNGTTYIGAKATCTLYNIQGQPNEEKEYFLHFNPDGTVDFNSYSTGFRVDEIEGGIVWLASKHELLVGTRYQLAMIPKAAYDAAVKVGWKA